MVEQLERPGVLEVLLEEDVETKAALLGSAQKQSGEVCDEVKPGRCSWAKEQDSQMRCCRKLCSDCPRRAEAMPTHTSPEFGEHQGYRYPQDHIWDVALLVALLGVRFEQLTGRGFDSSMLEMC